MPLVSILIPCRNAAQWLRACIDSALAQTHPDIEVIVFDDGSTDDSLSALADLNDVRLRLMKGPGQGGNIARNALLAVASGEWVQFLDADDYLQPDKISRQLSEVVGNTNPDVLYSPVLVETWHDGKPGLLEPTIIDLSTDIFTQWINWELPQTGGALWRRSALLDLGGWKEDQRCCQEHELYLRALQSDRCFQFCATPGAVYRIWSETTVCRRDPVQVIREKTRLIRNLLSWLETHDHLRPTHRLASGQVFFEMARTWARFDRDAAAAFFRDMARQGLINPIGPAAPLTYRLCLTLLGFHLTERLAATLRKSS